LQFGANPNIVAFDSSTPVTEALTHRNLPLTMFLVRNGAKPTKSAGLSAEVLSLAVEAGSLPLLKELIQAGWDPKRLPRKPLLNPLSTAVKAENYRLVKLLVDNGADPSRASAFQAAPLALAAGAKDERILRYLQRS
jgi:ankyrin repeat protein